MYRKYGSNDRSSKFDVEAPRQSPVLVAPPQSDEEIAWSNIHRRIEDPDQAAALIEIFAARPDLARGHEGLFIQATMNLRAEARKQAQKRKRRAGLRRIIDLLLPADEAPAAAPAPAVTYAAALATAPASTENVHRTPTQTVEAEAGGEAEEVFKPVRKAGRKKRSAAASEPSENLRRPELERRLEELDAEEASGIEQIPGARDPQA